MNDAETTIYLDKIFMTSVLLWAAVPPKHSLLKILNLVISLQFCYKCKKMLLQFNYVLAINNINGIILGIGNVKFDLALNKRWLWAGKKSVTNLNGSKKELEENYCCGLTFLVASDLINWLVTWEYKKFYASIISVAWEHLTLEDRWADIVQRPPQPNKEINCYKIDEITQKNETL